MDSRLSGILKSAVTVWVRDAVEQLMGHAEQMAELKKCTERDDGEVRVVFQIKANAISLVTIDKTKGIITQLFREELTPGDSFALPDMDKKQ